MDCPRCRKPLNRKEVRETEVDVCESCGGMFLERGELNRIAPATSGDLEFSTLHDESYRHDDKFPTISCPKCGDVETRKVEFNIYTNIILDHCDGCGGFWLDGEELGRINNEVRELDGSSKLPDEPRMLWFARFIWSLPR